MKRLVKVCGCGQKLTVDVDDLHHLVVVMRPLANRGTRFARHVNCITGCALGSYSNGRKLGPKKLNDQGHIRAVMCLSCHGTRHLNTFIEVKV